MGNKICELPRLLHDQLQDFSQMFQDINYIDIMNFSIRVNDTRYSSDLNEAYKLIIELDKKGFYDEEVDVDPHKYPDYTELINLIKQNV